MPLMMKLEGGDEVVVLDVATGAWAATRPDLRSEWTVRQYGPLRLWDAVEEAIDLVGGWPGLPTSSVTGSPSLRSGSTSGWTSPAGRAGGLLV